MIENYVRRVEGFYTSALASTGEERDRRIYDLARCLRNFQQSWGDDPLADPTRAISYRVVRHLRGSETVSFCLQRELDAIEMGRFSMKVGAVIAQVNRTNNFYTFYEFINSYQKKYNLNVESSVGDILEALDEARSTLIEKKLYNHQLDDMLSYLVVKRFNLSRNDNIDLKEVTGNRDHQLRLLAHLCTTKIEFVPYLLLLNQDDLKKVAFHFYRVPIFAENTSEEWFKRFLKYCENATFVHIHCPITALSSNDLPPHVEEIKWLHCKVERLSLTLPKLKEIEVWGNKLRSFELNAPHLTRVSLMGSPDLESLHLNTPHLETFIMDKTSLSTLTLDCPFLFILHISRNARLNTITLLHTERLAVVSFEGCTTLRSFTEPGQGLPSCRTLNLYNCPAAIPQVPITAEVYTGTRRNRGALVSFRVNPKVLEENPLKVLLDFGKILEQQIYFPNIVWINPLTGAEAEGIDGGGIRRHFVATLTEKLPPILKDELALETFGRLIGFAAESSLLLGTRLPLEFFYELLSEAGPSEITKGVKATLGPKWASWKRNLEESDANFTNRVKLFADQVQGKPVTIENLLPLLQFDGEDVATTKEYFRRFFSEFPLLVDERVFQLKHFHQLMLGSLSLEGRPIAIHVRGSGKWLPSIHACSGEMEIPAYPDYQTFKEKLTWAFRAHDTFEAI